MRSPWGEVYTKRNLADNIISVTTPSHGGIMVHESQWGVLTEAAQRRGIRYGEYLAYEEDCAVMIVLYELADVRLELGIKEAAVVNSLCTWNADYLMERGINPAKLAPESYCYWLENRLGQAMRNANDPDLIVVAWGMDEDVTRVATADGMEHYISAVRYRQPRMGLNLLSFQTLVKKPT